MSQSMRHAVELDGPLTIELKSGERVKVAYVDGGGMFVGSDEYEVHGRFLDGGFLCITQDKIERVLTASGEEVEFGNPDMPGHPRPTVYE